MTGMLTGFAGKFQPAGGFQGMRVKGADFGGPADIQRHHQPVAGDSGGDDAGALRQDRRGVGGATALPSVRKRR